MVLKGKNSKKNAPEEVSKGNHHPPEDSPMATYNSILDEMKKQSDEMKKSFSEQNKYIESLKLELEVNCDKNSEQLRTENSVALAQIEKQTKITFDSLSSQINDLKGEPL